jgi:hypothetical protein
MCLYVHTTMYVSWEKFCYLIVDAHIENVSSPVGNSHGLRTPREEIAFTARPRIHSHSQIFRYGGSIFCLPHRPNFSDIFDLWLHWVSVVRGNSYIFYFIKRMAMRKNVCTYICVSQHINIVFLIMSGIKSTFAPPLLIKIYFFRKNL